MRKRSFLITTILTPFLMLGIMIAPALLMNNEGGTRNAITVNVTDRSGLIAEHLEDRADMAFSKNAEISDEQLQELISNGRGSYLIIGEDIISNNSAVKLYSDATITMDMENGIRSQVERIIEDVKLKSYGIENLQQIIDDINTRVDLSVYKISESGDSKASSGFTAMGMALIFSLFIYMFVMLYGVTVMNGVIEEKNSKVLEILVSSVKPFELMLGKILGIAAVALTQFLIWTVIIMAASTYISGFIGMDGMGQQAIAAMSSITDPWFLIRMLGGFFLYFIGGYLLYAAMYAALGSAVENIQDAQQMQMPATLPLILSILIMASITRDPNSATAFWFSMIPFTSPVIMMARLPYGVPGWELALSLGVLYGSFIAMVWAAGKIYRVGIFMYGKKPSFGEILKWIKYKS